MIKPIELPEAGRRIGCKCGPGEFAPDNAGSVLTRVPSRFGDYVLVLMDDATTKTCHGMNSRPGLGWHYL